MFFVLSLFFMFLRLGGSSLGGGDTEAEDTDDHQLDRLVELLTSAECEDLLFALSHPAKSILDELNEADQRQEAPSEDPISVGSEAECRAGLTDWLQRHGEQTYHDRLTLTLQHIGRMDIAMEVGKSDIQENLLNLKRYVEGYHKYVSSLKSPVPQSGAKNQPRGAGQRVRVKKARGQAWRHSELIVERAPVPPYQKGPLDVFLPVLYGMLVGFFGPLLVGALIVHVTIRMSSRNKRTCQSSARL